MNYKSESKNYRTPIVNSVIGHIADISKDLSENKNGTSQFYLEKSRSVALGIDLSNFLEDFQSIKNFMNCWQN